jgi:putative addiction module component (TIGR02574 family)
MIDLKEIKKLSVEERILIVEAIWDSITEDNSTPINFTKEQEAEITRRIDLHESGEGVTYTWDEVKRKLDLKGK